MAGPLNGIGGQQVLLATTFQPGQNSQQVRQQQQSDASNVQNKNTQSVQPQKSETASNQNALRSLSDKALNPDGNEKTEQRRGSTIDITV